MIHLTPDASPITSCGSGTSSTRPPPGPCGRGWPLRRPCSSAEAEEQMALAQGAIRQMDSRLARSRGLGSPRGRGADGEADGTA